VRGLIRRVGDARHRAFELVTVSANFPDEKKAVLAFLQKNEASNQNLLFADVRSVADVEECVRAVRKKHGH